MVHVTSDSALCTNGYFLLRKKKFTRNNKEILFSLHTSPTRHNSEAQVPHNTRTHTLTQGCHEEGLRARGSSLSRHTRHTGAHGCKKKMCPESTTNKRRKEKNKSVLPRVHKDLASPAYFLDLASSLRVIKESSLGRSRRVFTNGS